MDRLDLRGVPGGLLVLLALGGGLFLVHVGHALGEDESITAFLFGILVPMLFSAAVFAGGLWAWRRWSADSLRRIALWSVVGAGILALGAVLTIIYEQSHGVILADQEFVVVNLASFGSLIGFVVGLYDAERTRQKDEILARAQTLRARERLRNREQALNDLHETTRTLMQTTDKEAIAQHVVDAGRDILEMPLSGCWLYDETAQALLPAADTEESAELVGELPTYTGAGSLSWEAYRTGEIKLFEDVHEHPDRYNSETPIRSEIILPLGEQGVLNIGSTEVGAFGEMDVSLARVLAANAEVALERADRERKLATTQHQLTVLNRVLRHDLRNAANVVRGNAEILRSNGSDRADRAETIVQQAQKLVDISGRARDVEQMIQSEGHDREVIDIVSLLDSELEQVTGAYPAVETSGPELDTCHVSAHPLCPSAIANVIDNAAEHNDKSITRIDVSCTERDDHVDVRIADNGPGIPESEIAVLERGYETTLEHTSGLGLWLVNWIVEASGGEIWFEENEPEGSVVCLRFQQADAQEPPGSERLRADAAGRLDDPSGS